MIYEAKGRGHSNREYCHVHKKSNWKAACSCISSSQTQLRGNRNMGHLEKGKINNVFLFNYITDHGFFFFFDTRIFLENFRWGSRDLESYKRIRFTSVMLALQSWCSDAVAAIANASPSHAIFYLPSVKPTPLLPLLSISPLLIWQLCPLWVTGTGCSAAALWHIPSQLRGSGKGKIFCWSWPENNKVFLVEILTD